MDCGERTEPELVYNLISSRLWSVNRGMLLWLMVRSPCSDSLNKDPSLKTDLKNSFNLLDFFRHHKLESNIVLYYPKLTQLKVNLFSLPLFIKPCNFYLTLKGTPTAPPPAHTVY